MLINILTRRLSKFTGQSAEWIYISLQYPEEILILFHDTKTSFQLNISKQGFSRWWHRTELRRCSSRVNKPLISCCNNRLSNIDSEEIFCQASPSYRSCISVFLLVQDLACTRISCRPNSMEQHRRCKIKSVKCWLWKNCSLINFKELSVHITWQNWLVSGFPSVSHCSMEWTLTSSRFQDAITKLTL